MREQLPNRRGSETMRFDLNGTSFVLTVSRFGDGRIAELFLNGAKLGSGVDTVARDAAVVASIALQYGVPLDVIRHSLSRDSRGVAIGPLGCALDLLAS